MVNVNDNCVSGCFSHLCHKIHVLAFPLWLVFFSSKLLSSSCLCLFLPLVPVATPALHQPPLPTDSPTPGPGIPARSWRGSAVTRRYLVGALGGTASALVIQRREVLQTVNSNGRPSFKNYSTAVVPWDDKKKLLQVLLNQLLVSIWVIGTHGGKKTHPALTSCNMRCISLAQKRKFHMLKMFQTDLRFNSEWQDQLTDYLLESV